MLANISPLLKNRALSVVKKKKIVDLLVPATLFYAAETWDLTTTQERQVEAFQIRAYRICLGMKTTVTTTAEGIKQFEHVRTEKVIKAINKAINEEHKHEANNDNGKKGPTKQAAKQKDFVRWPDILRQRQKAFDTDVSLRARSLPERAVTMLNIPGRCSTLTGRRRKGLAAKPGNAA